MTQTSKDALLIATWATECRDRKNDWPGMPLGQLPLYMRAALREAVNAGVVTIFERPSKIEGKRTAVFVVPAGG